MSNNAYIIFPDGEVFVGKFLLFPKRFETTLVFNTAVAGYQEVVTDPSYFCQSVLFTFPQIGSYGVFDRHDESHAICVDSVIVETYDSAQETIKKKTFRRLLKNNGIPLITNIHARDLSYKIRTFGASRVLISPYIIDTKKQYVPTPFPSNIDKKITNFLKIQTQNVCINKTNPLLVVYNFGIKRSIVKQLSKGGFRLVIVPYNTPYQEIKKRYPDRVGIFLSNGPGDPSSYLISINEIKKMIIGSEKLIAICLGHQLISIAQGFSTTKLKFGHHGINHPVSCSNNKIFVTSQNHDYVVKNDKNSKQEYFSLMDKSNEGYENYHKNIFSVQFHPEGGPGPIVYDVFKKMKAFLLEK